MSKNPKLLIITYYWPPSGGAGVQRCLKFSKYLADFGWEPIIFTAKDADYPIIDESLNAQVKPGTTIVRQEIWEPYDWYKRFVGIKKEDKVQAGFIEEKEKNSQLHSLATWVRGNFFIPDARRFWIKPSIQFLSAYLKEHPVDAILSSGPPHSVHMIAQAIRKETGIPWIADFRDPWTNIDYYNQLKLSKWADRQHHKMEKSVIKNADAVVTVSWHWADEFREMGANNVHVITNGFDENDFAQQAPELDQKFTISHIGTTTKDRNPQHLWEVLGELGKELPDFLDHLSIQFIGKTDFSIFSSMAKNSLKEQTVKIDHLAHREALTKVASSQLLLLLVNDAPNSMGRIPLKLYEYLAAQRPILCIGYPQGDAARIIREQNAGVALGFEDKDLLKEKIKAYYEAFLKGELVLDGQEDISVFSRQSLTGELVELLEELTAY